MKLFKLTLVLFFVVAIGCNRTPPPSSSTVGNSDAPTGSQFIVTSEPAGATGVGEARKTAIDGATVVVVGHVGGSATPFVDGVAAFSIVDPSVSYCQPAEGCPTPWDYCCTQDQVKDNIATVKIVDGQGKLVAEDARKLLGVRELSLVVVQGSARRDDAGNLTVLAEKVFIR